MEKKDRIDLFGGTSLVLVTVMFGLNQVLVKVVNAGLQPVFSAGMRSALAFLALFLFALWRRKRLSIRDGTLRPGILAGALFAAEFLMLFVALDHTTVARVSIFFYTMPIWLSIGAHFLLPDDRITRSKAIGLLLATIGVVWAMADRGHGAGSLFGDMLSTIAAIFWAAIALTARTSRLNRSSPVMQMLYQLAVSAIILLPVSLLFGPLIRDLQMMHLAVFAVMVFGVTAAGFPIWFWILSVYPASKMAAFSFLSPVFGVFFGWLILGEKIGPTIIGALVLVSVGIVLINRRPRFAA